MIHRLLVVEEVVDDDVRSRSAERLDVGRELRRATQTGREVEFGIWGQVVNDREDLFSLVALACLPWQYCHSVQQVVRSVTRHEWGHTRREHTDTDACAVDTVTLPHRYDLPCGGSPGPAAPYLVSDSWPLRGRELRR